MKKEEKTKLYPKDPDFLSEYLVEPVTPKVMTNKEAADILKEVVSNMVYPRGCGKTGTILRRFEAYGKAIELLENTPD